MNRFFNTFLTSILVFALTFSWLNYCTKSKILSALLALSTATAICTLMYLTGKNKAQKQLTTKRERVALHTFDDFLVWNGNNAELFADLLAFCNYNTSILPNGYLLLQQNNKKYLATTCFVATETLSPSVLQNAVATAKQVNATKILLFTNRDLPVQVPFEMQTYNLQQTYALFCACGKLPAVKNCTQPAKRFALSSVFNKKLFGKYAVGSLFLAVFSMFSFFPFYTLVWSSILFALALLSLFIGKNQPTGNRMH